MENYLHDSTLTRDDLISIIDNVPDSIHVYDSKKRLVTCSNLVRESLHKKEDLIKSASPQIRAQLQESDAEMEQVIAHVLNTAAPKTFMHMSPHYPYPMLFTARPILDEHGSVKFVIVNGRSQAVVNKFSQEYVKLQEHLERNQESLRLLSQLHLKGTEIIAESPSMRQILKAAYRVAQTDCTVTIIGDSGTGKEVIANAIHQNSIRKDEVFVPVNCSAIPSELMEAEFFGFVSGAFTGAKANGRVGLFELANNGTLFLDEIGELPLNLQPKLLRVLESGEIRPIGSNVSKKVNVRIIAATNRDLEQMVKQKEFREDLYYRLQIVPLALPSLKDRPEDIVPLAEHFLRINNKRHHRNCYLTDGAKHELLQHSWPGNIRELRNLIERLVIVSEVDAIVQMQIIAYTNPLPLPNTAIPGIESSNYYDAVNQFEKAYIDQILNRCNGDVSEAAEVMGVHKSMLYKKIKKFKESQL